MARVTSSVVLFTFNPFWRDTSHGIYMFVMNYILNYNDLDVGLAASEKATDTFESASVIQ